MNGSIKYLSIRLRFRNCSIYGLIAFCILDHLFGYVTRVSFSTVVALSSACIGVYLPSTFPCARALCYSRKVCRLSSSFAIDKNWFIVSPISCVAKPGGTTNLYVNKNRFHQLTASTGGSRDLPKQGYTHPNIYGIYKSTDGFCKIQKLLLYSNTLRAIKLTRFYEISTSHRRTACPTGTKRSLNTM